MRDTPMTDLALAPGCPLDGVLRFLAQAWIAHVVWALGRGGAMRFGALRRALPGDISARVLSARLRHLTTLGLVRRDAAGAPPLAASYRLTDAGAQVDAFLLEMDGLATRTPLPGLCGQR